MDTLNTNSWRLGFVQWNAQRLGITAQDSLARYNKSWNLFTDGHAGSEFRKFDELVHDAYSVFYDDNAGEVYNSYEKHADLHLLRQLTYQVPVWKSGDLIVETLAARRECTIVDYGCGLAQYSLSLTRFLASMGVQVQLFLADIPSIKLDFLRWFLAHVKVNATILPCTKEQPVPDLPASDFIVATEVLEHIHDPMHQLLAFDASLRSHGLLYTNLGMHQREFFHVSPDLSALRLALLKRNYAELQQNVVFQKA